MSSKRLEGLSKSPLEARTVSQRLSFTRGCLNADKGGVADTDCVVLKIQGM